MIEMKRKTLVISLALGFVIGVILSLTLLRRGDKDSPDKELGPGETIELFCRTVASGDFKGAYALCDTTTMKDYIQNCSRAWNMLQKQDSNALGIASGILSDMQIEIDDISKDGNSRSVFYTINAGEGLSKQKVAIVRKEEGEWKVSEIIDRQ